MRKKYYNRFTSFPDRFPFIILALIMVFAVIFVFQFKTKYPLPFFSGGGSATQDMENTSYPILVATPTGAEIFDFVNKNEFVPIEIKSKTIEKLDYKLNLIIDDKDIIKTFTLPPYSYDWHPPEPGEYILAANLVDSSNKTISSSNKVKFEVKLKYEEKTITTEATPTTPTAVTEEALAGSAPTIKLEIYEGPTYSAGDDICYYRIKAIVTGDPAPIVTFSKDDSGGAWGRLKTQINLTRNSPTYTLTAKAKNSTGQATDSISLSWGCE
ncbi:MAG: hypothetical protein M1365_08300 [Actinobacteria bacterium]|nr:hypothetical protein [Actinomycetota bacterium]